MNCGLELRNARLAREWSRAALAEEAGLDVADIEAIENGESECGLHQVLAALQLQEVQLLLPRMLAGFLRAAGPVVEGIPEERLPIALAGCLDVLGRAAAGIKGEPTSLVIASGGAQVVFANTADVDQNVA